ncbi:hypothetical protein EV127DRAFT_407782 [Xylaria flabelliformis]|nr:hypothetical protein EV127DRAFT_407782 [Xylaria flabelliformis]
MPRQTDNDLHNDQAKSSFPTAEALQQEVEARCAEWIEGVRDRNSSASSSQTLNIPQYQQQEILKGPELPKFHDALPYQQREISKKTNLPKLQGEPPKEQNSAALLQLPPGIYHGARDLLLLEASYQDPGTQHAQSAISRLNSVSARDTLHSQRILGHGNAAPTTLRRQPALIDPAITNRQYGTYSARTFEPPPPPPSHYRSGNLQNDAATHDNSRPDYCRKHGDAYNDQCMRCFESYMRRQY